MGLPENGPKISGEFSADDLNVALLELLETAFPSVEDATLRADITTYLTPDSDARFAMTVHPLEADRA